MGGTEGEAIARDHRCHFDRVKAIPQAAGLVFGVRYQSSCDDATLRMRPAALLLTGVRGTGLDTGSCRRTGADLALETAW